MDQGAAIWAPLSGPREGPPLASVTARLRATPADVVRPGVVVEALLADTLEVVDPRPLQEELAARLAEPAGPPPGEPATPDGTVPTTPAGRAAAAVTCWLLAAPDLAHALAGGADPRGVATLVVHRMAAYVDVLPLAAWLGRDPDRQEEVARAVLRAAGLRPLGETPAQSEDRWTSISTASRSAALREAAVRQAWAEEVARRLAERRAREAAAQYTHV